MESGNCSIILPRLIEPETMEPLLFDCLTDAQVWSLFDTGVLQSCLLPVAVYARLERIAPDHGCYLFVWPIGQKLPSLQDMVSGMVAPGEERPTQTLDHHIERRPTVERMRSTIEAFCARMHDDMPAAGQRVWMLTTSPRLELSAGPYLEPQARDLNAMSLAELEAYLNAALQVDGGA